MTHNQAQNLLFKVRDSENQNLSLEQPQKNVDVILMLGKNIKLRNKKL
jgi:hypothetical protein